MCEDARTDRVQSRCGGGVKVCAEHRRHERIIQPATYLELSDRGLALAHLIDKLHVRPGLALDGDDFLQPSEGLAGQGR